MRHLLPVVLLHLRDRLDARAQVGVLLREHRLLLRERLLEHRQLGAAGGLALDERGVAHRYEEFDGDHGWDAWTDRIEHSLLFFDNLLKEAR